MEARGPRPNPGDCGGLSHPSKHEGKSSLAGSPGSPIPTPLLPCRPALSCVPLLGWRHLKSAALPGALGGKNMGLEPEELIQALPAG